MNMGISVLTKALRKQQSSNHVHRLMAQDKSIQDSSAIAWEFRSFY